MSDSPASRGEEEAWQDVLARWDDESSHQAYLNRLADLEGLMQAGRRYRSVLESRPDDPVALRWRDEIVKRATVQGLAQLPRTQPPSPLPRWVRVALVSMATTIAAWLLWLAGSRLAQAFNASRGAVP